jgi:hypothetical protein
MFQTLLAEIRAAVIGRIFLCRPRPRSNPPTRNASATGIKPATESGAH